ncbi:MAG: sigma 54-interacting transcriptional regulator [Firmicutes bacterium]|nr:sigma 54-interacting transcriptional regulator [Bacillota bacterium]
MAKQEVIYMENCLISFDNPNQLINLAETIHQLMPVDCMIGVTNLSKFLTYIPGKNIDANLRRGATIRKGDAIDASLLRKEKIVMEVPKEIYGFPFYGVGIPIGDNRDNIIGSLGIGINKKELSFKNLYENSELTGKSAGTFYIFEDPAMKRIYNLCLRIAPYNSTVLITGESGVGKEVIAKIIHEHSLRSQGTFLQINCGAIPINLLESELFGYEQGAFTGARKGGKIGIIEKCHNGTLLLDEIADLSLELQVKLLRVIQEQEILRVGATNKSKINVRFLAATNKNLQEMIDKKVFRNDLFYRLNVIPIHIPPLRKRKDDIIPLALSTIKKINKKYGTKKELNKDVLSALRNYAWPGNIREMENLIERLAVITDEDIIGIDELAFCRANLGSDMDNLHLDSKSGINIEIFNPIPYKEAVEVLEKNLLAATLSMYPSVRKTAKVLGVSHPTVVRKANQYQLIKNGKYIID